jgi:hypothetical protein
MKSFLEKYLKFQQEVENATKNASNPHFKSKYANLEQVLATVKPVLNDNKMVFLQQVVPADIGFVSVKTTLFCTESAEFVDSTVTVPAGTDAQKYGSALTYARRYSLATLCGITQEDDDGNHASKVENANDGQVARLYVNESQVRKVMDLLDGDMATLDKIKQHYGLKSLDDMSLSTYHTVIKHLEQKNKG